MVKIDQARAMDQAIEQYRHIDQPKNGNLNQQKVLIDQPSWWLMSRSKFSIFLPIGDA
jgi:hypothetical protein